AGKAALEEAGAAPTVRVHPVEAGVGMGRAVVADRLGSPELLADPAHLPARRTALVGFEAIAATACRGDGPAGLTGEGRGRERPAARNRDHEGRESEHCDCETC